MKAHKSNGKKAAREYDFSKGVRGKYAARYPGSNVVVLEADVAKTFPDSKSVNDALRAVKRLVELARAR